MNQLQPRFESRIITQSPLLPGLLGLRGFAALAVVLFHLVHIGHINPPQLFAFVSNDFGRGVHLFFVLSAFSLMYSTSKRIAEHRWLHDYFVKRFFRIAPLYYALLIAMVTWPLISRGNWSHSLDAIILNATFTFGFAPWTSIVWGGWSVGVEMLFYLVFPVLLLTIRTLRAALFLLLACILVSGASHLNLHNHFALSAEHYPYNWAYFSFAPNLIYFAAGICSFKWLYESSNRGANIGYLSAFISSLTIIFLLFNGGSIVSLEESLLESFFWLTGLTTLCLWQASKPSWLATNRAALFLGERSYSIYLIHPILIALLDKQLLQFNEWLEPIFGPASYFICFTALFCALLPLVELTYRAIELPSINMGRHLIRAQNPLPSTASAN